MVLLTMTPSMVAAVNVYNKHTHPDKYDEDSRLQNPQVGDPISHDQLISISRFFKDHTHAARHYNLKTYRLADLLRGCRIYTPPPPPKPEKSDEYKALMARLRKEQEAKQYERMLQQPESFEQRQGFSTASADKGYLFPPKQEEMETEEMTYADVNRQLALIANVLISILACSIGVWKTAWHWDVPARLALSMLSSIVVAVAEVAIYMGYIGRLDEAKAREKRKVEKKSIKESWVIEGKGRRKEKEKVQEVLLPPMGMVDVDKIIAEGMRFRKA